MIQSSFAEGPGFDHLLLQFFLSLCIVLNISFLILFHSERVFADVYTPVYIGDHFLW
jgi:hypothetical protein